MSAALVALVAAATAPTGLSLAQNLGWPSADPGLGGAALADPRLMPDDPAYAPQGLECAGQRAWWSFAPSCARALAESERALGVGVGVDRAWLRTIGRADVTGALLLVDTPDLASRALARRVRLAAGELPPVDVGDGRPRLDRDGDGVSTLADWVDADGRAVDVRLRARLDGGDVDGDGRVDPFDLAAIFADGRDDDGNGLADDILGWDWVRNAPLERPTRSTPSGALARALAEEANDGDGGIGVCPRCTVRVFVVGDDVAGRHAAHALRALDPVRTDGGQALVALLESTPESAGAALLGALGAARAAGLTVVAGLDARGGVSVDAAWDRLATAGPLGPNDLALADWSSAFLPTPGATTAPSTRIASPEPASAILAGALLLAQARARDVRGQDVRFDPETLDALLAATATRLPGSDGRLTLAAGAGRLDARALVDAAERAAPVPSAHLVAPTPWALVDPTRGAPVEVVIESAARGERYSLSIASGVDVAPSSWSVIARGALDIPRLTLGVDVVGLERDPLAPPGPPLSRTHTLRLVVEPPPGGAGPPREVRRTIYVHRDAELLVGFPLELGATVHVTPRVFADADGDSIVIADDEGRVSRVDLRGTPRPGWPARLELGDAGAGGDAASRDRPIGAPVVFDLDDRRRAWATLGASGRLHVLDAEGRAVAGFPRAVPDALVDEGTWLVVDADDDVTLLVGTRSGVAALGVDGAPRRGFPIDVGARPSAPALLGRRWVFTADGALRAFDLTGEVETIVGLDRRALEAPLVGPVQGERRLRVVVPSPPFRVFVTDLQGELSEADLPLPGGRAELDERPFEDGDVLRSYRLAPGGRALAATRGDGTYALFAPLVDTATTGWLGALPLGDDRSSAPPPLAMRTRRKVTPSAIDVDGDGTVELVAPDDEERLRAIGPSGPLRGWPKLLGAPLAGAPQVARAGTGGALVVVTTRGRVLAYRLDGDPDRAAVWLGPRHDARNTASLDTPVRSDLASSNDDAASCATAPRNHEVHVLGLLLLLARPRRRGTRSHGAHP